MNQRGLSLIELMVSMLLGLMLMSGVGSVFLANRQTYRSNEGLSQLQESARSAFEVLSRDLRQVGLTACGNTGRIANVLNGATSNAFMAWVGLAGFDAGVAAPGTTIGAATGQRAAGTSAIQVQGIDGGVLSISSHNAATGNITINAASTDWAAGDILMVCDSSQTTIFHSTAYNSGTVAVGYAVGSGEAGNCSNGLGFPTDCSSSAGNPYTYSPNSSIARIQSSVWYVGNNGRTDEGGHSLYRVRLGTDGNPVTEEIVAGISGLQIQYHVRGAEVWANATAVSTAGNWDSVDAVELALAFESAEAQVSTDAATNNGRLQRNFTLVIALRNRTL